MIFWNCECFQEKVIFSKCEFLDKLRIFAPLCISVFPQQKMWRYACFVLLFAQASMALQIPQWSDVFSSLKPYKDPETLLLEEDGEARLGFVQVSLESWETPFPFQYIVNEKEFFLHRIETASYLGDVRKLSDITFLLVAKFRGHVLQCNIEFDRAYFARPWYCILAVALHVFQRFRWSGKR